ncbi:MAG TPA: hypothetical protein VMU49_05200 [Candidatus Acidoferrales bacterium]|nr:hypothetical protein [Candidatus Acidoferrales bacterium]
MGSRLVRLAVDLETWQAFQALAQSEARPASEMLAALVRFDVAAAGTISRAALSVESSSPRANGG